MSGGTGSRQGRRLLTVGLVAVLTAALVDLGGSGTATGATATGATATGATTGVTSERSARTPTPRPAAMYGAVHETQLLDLPAALRGGGVTDISVNYQHALAARNGRVYAWGRLPDLLRVPKIARSGVTKVSAGYYHSVALKNGRVIAWGLPSSVQHTGIPSSLRSGVDDIAAGQFHTLALKDGRVIAWGTLRPEGVVPPTATAGIVAIDASDSLSMALTTKGRVIIWGDQDDWPVRVPKAARRGVSAIALGTWHALAVKDGRVIAWGEANGSDELAKALAVPRAARSGVVAVAAGDYQSYALKADGSVVTWGEYTDLVTPTVPVVEFEAYGATMAALVSTPQP